MIKDDSWYKLSNPDEIDSPALLIYENRVLHNIKTLIGMVDDVSRLRPHVKTHKSKDVCALLLQAGIQKFKCATIAEMEMLAESGARDVLLAYQPVGPKQDRLLELKNKYPKTRIACLIDAVDVSKQLSSKSLSAGSTLDVFIDLNVGMNRTGVLPVNFNSLYEQCQDLKGINMVGVHAYDGHLGIADFKERRIQCDAAFQVVEDLLTNLGEDGKSLIVVAGGSPTFPIHAQRKNIECSPGTFIYWDWGYSEKCAEQDFLPAAVVLSRIISLPDEGKLCLDLGHKSIASENPLDRRVKFLNAPDLKFTGQSEEHLMAEAGPGHAWKVGDVLYGVPMHICPTVALHNLVHVIEGGDVKTTWPTTARGRKISV